VFTNAFKLWWRQGRAFPCPVCGFWVPRSPLLRTSFACPRCGTWLYLSLRGWGQATLYTVTWLLAILLPYIAGVRGLIIVLVAMGASIPIAYVVASVVLTIFGKLERVLPPAGERTRGGAVRVASHYVTLGLSGEPKEQASKQQNPEDTKADKA
jgi:predicted RNA-binding Zn-ribbon protein involved in translation (DUF1610 family)